MGIGSVLKVRELDNKEMYSVLVSTSKGTPYRYSSKAYKHLVDKYNKILKYKRCDAVEWFFTNVGRALRNNFSGFSVKLDKNYWSGNDCGVGIKNVKHVLDYMQKNEYIDVLKGSHDYRCEWLSYVSIVRFNQKLVDLFDKEKVNLYIPSRAMPYPIVLKDRESKEEIEIEKTEQVEKMAQEMNRYNNSLACANIKFDGQDVPLLEYHRTFSGDFESGGRLFAHGGSIQIVPQEYRLSSITIDGQKVVELDYSANHPRILYEYLIQEKPHLIDEVSSEIDPYLCNMDALKVDKIAIESHKLKYGIAKYNPIRSFLKHAMMRALNCDSFEKAFASLSTEVFKDKQRPEQHRLFVGLIKPECRQALSNVCSTNEHIAHQFFQDKGIWLQHIDSEIALRVIDIMLQNGEVVLCWHDSFQCRESAKDMLYSAMKEAWKDVLGSNLFVKIDQK